MQRAIIQTLFSATAYSSILILIFAFYPVFDWLLQVFEKVNKDKLNNVYKQNGTKKVRKKKKAPTDCNL